MKKIAYSSQFKKDYKRIQKRSYPIENLTHIISLLANDAILPVSCRPHKLRGNYENFWECHIGPNWLLIYEYNEHELLLRRTGTHSDLFQ